MTLYPEILAQFMFWSMTGTMYMANWLRTNIKPYYIGPGLKSAIILIVRLLFKALVFNVNQKRENLLYYYIELAKKKEEDMFSSFSIGGDASLVPVKTIRRSLGVVMKVNREDLKFLSGIVLTNAFMNIPLWFYYLQSQNLDFYVGFAGSIAFDIVYRYAAYFYTRRHITEIRKLQKANPDTTSMRADYENALNAAQQDDAIAPNPAADNNQAQRASAELQTNSGNDSITNSIGLSVSRNNSTVNPPKTRKSVFDQQILHAKRRFAIQLRYDMMASTVSILATAAILLVLIAPYNSYNICNGSLAPVTSVVYINTAVLLLLHMAVDPLMLWWFNDRGNIPVKYGAVIFAPLVSGFSSTVFALLFALTWIMAFYRDMLQTSTCSFQP